MATARETVDHILEQLEPLDVRARAMFGEYCLYCNDKPVALICNERLHLKPTPASDGREFPEEEAYPGSRQYRVVGPETIEDPKKFSALVQATADALPVHSPRKGRVKRGRSNQASPAG